MMRAEEWSIKQACCRRRPEHSGCGKDRNASRRAWLVILRRHGRGARFVPDAGGRHGTGTVALETSGVPGVHRGGVGGIGMSGGGGGRNLRGV
jgi:hypothetical protein